MKQRSRIAFGPGAASLILIVVVLSLSVLGILSLMSARSDLAFSERSVAIIEAVYTLDNQAERTYGELDALMVACRKQSETDEEYLENISSALSIDMEMDENTIYWEETDGVRTIECMVEVQPLASEQRLKWLSHRLYAEIDGNSFW